MNTVHTQDPRDPLARFREGAVQTHNGRPIPLRSTHFDVHIRGGLAVVRTERVFRNDEVESIEATLTFPVPVHAVLTGLSARIGDRTLTAQARRRDAARARYEAAIDSGRTAVLHEEAMRGIHILSVGHVPPGSEVAVTCVWAQPLARTEAGAALRIPTTIGDIYGRPPLADGDAPIHAGVRHAATLAVSCDSGTVVLNGGALADGSRVVLLNAPIDLAVADWTPHPLAGRAADGRRVTLDIVPAPRAEAPVHVALLIDRSGSMSTGVASGAGKTAHGRVADGLRSAAGLIGPADRVEGWQFDNQAEKVPVEGTGLAAIANALGAPRGGTEIGAALNTVLRHSHASDLLLVTDGQSYVLDVQEIARTGRRVTVVLVGEASLDAQVGHLAALTGGQLFIVSGADAGGAVRQAIASLRTPHVRPPALAELPGRIETQQSGMTVAAAWSDARLFDAAAPEGEDAQIVGAVAASLALPSLPEKDATALAEAHGLVTHLTSLVLVDEAGAVQGTVPVQRQVPLMTPGVLADAALQVSLSVRPEYCVSSHREDFVPVQPRVPGVTSPPARSRSIFPSFFRRATRSLWRTRIDWNANPAAVQRGDLKALDPNVAAAVRVAASLPAVVALAAALGADPVVVVLALLARRDSHGNRTARRIAEAVLRGADPASLTAAADAVRDVG